MKLPTLKLNNRGFSHHFIMMLVVLGTAVGGTAYLVASHAQVPYNNVYSCPSQPTLSVSTGSSSPTCTKYAQYVVGGIAVDGSFGPLTQSAVRSFQYNNHVGNSGCNTAGPSSCDGIIGSATWSALVASNTRQTQASVAASAPKGTLTCTPVSPNDITVHATYSNAGTAGAKLYRATTLLTSYPTASGNTNFPVGRLAASTTYSFSLHSGTATLATASCTTGKLAATTTPPAPTTATTTPAAPSPTNTAACATAVGSTYFYDGTRCVTLTKPTCAVNTTLDTVPGTNVTYYCKANVLTTTQPTVGAPTVAATGGLACLTNATAVVLNYSFSGTSSGVVLQQNGSTVKTVTTTSGSGSVAGVNIAPSTGYSYQLMSGTTLLAKAFCTTKAAGSSATLTAVGNTTSSPVTAIANSKPAVTPGAAKVACVIGLNKNGKPVYEKTHDKDWCTKRQNSLHINYRGEKLVSCVVDSTKKVLEFTKPHCESIETRNHVNTKGVLVSNCVFTDANGKNLNLPNRTAPECSVLKSNATKLLAFREATCAKNTPTVNAGSSNYPCVRYLQTQLKNRFVSSLSVDGQYGGQTTNAVRNVQLANKFKDTSGTSVGPCTWAAILGRSYSLANCVQVAPKPSTTGSSGNTTSQTSPGRQVAVQPGSSDTQVIRGTNTSATPVATESHGYKSWSNETTRKYFETVESNTGEVCAYTYFNHYGAGTAIGTWLNSNNDNYVMKIEVLNTNGWKELETTHTFHADNNNGTTDDYCFRHNISGPHYFRVSAQPVNTLNMRGNYSVRGFDN